MYPEDIPELNFQKAESEISLLLKQYNFQTSLGHLKAALSTFSQGNWTSTNAQLRTFYESYMEEIALKLGYEGSKNAVAVRNYLGSHEPPFLFEELKEWINDSNKHQYLQGLMSRMHPEGSHPGLSDEDDCTFRLHITLITARLFLRRFDKFNH